MRRSITLVAAAVLIRATIPAGAEEMMRPGPSPESGLAGVWRIIDARAAPWVKQHHLTKAEAPLLEYAVEFKPGEVRGPAPLACTAATYSSGVTYAPEWFGGKLAKDANGAMAAALRLSQPTTFRVICNGAARDYYVDEDADIVMAEGDVVYTLERPAGMNPEQYTAGFSGPSFDCVDALTTGERLICIDAALAKIDKKMGDAYQALKKSESQSSFATIQTAQRAWLSYVTKTCAADGAMPDNAGDRNTIIECLATDYGDRAELIAALAVDKAGALILEPRMRFRTRANPTTEETDIFPVMSGGPQATTFNAFAAKALRLDAWRMNDKALFRYGNDVNGARLHAHRSYSVVRFDSRIVSLRVATSDFVGGHDEEYGHSAFTWDLAQAKPVGLDDVFAPGAAWKKLAGDYCRKALTELVADMPADLDLSDIEATVATSANWFWGKDKATVMFTVFMNSGMPASPYDVDIPYAVLKPYMKSDAAVLANSR